MAIEPKKMEAFLAKDKSGGGDQQGGKGGGKNQPPGKGGKPPREPDDDHEGEDEEEEGDDERGAEGDLEERFPTLFQALEDFGSEVEDAGDTLETSDLEDDDLEDDAADMLDDAFDSLPKPVQKALKKEGSKIDRQTSNEIADALEAGGHIKDPDHFAALLFHLAKDG